MSSQSFGNDPEASCFPSTSAPYHQAPQPQFPCQDARRPAYRRLLGQERFPFRVFGSDTDADAKPKFNDLGPATFGLDGTCSNTKLYNRFNGEPKRFWKHHFSVSHLHGDDVLRLPGFLRVWREMSKEYRPELVFATTESAGLQDPTAAKSEAQAWDMIAAAWPKSLPHFHDFWRGETSWQREPFQSHLTLHLHDPKPGYLVTTLEALPRVRKSFPPFYCPNPRYV